jgi:GAF domain-containing protein
MGHYDPVLAAAWDELDRRYPVPEDLREGPYGVLRNGGYHFVPQMKEEAIRAYAKDAEHLRLLQATRMRSYICVPLVSRGRISGTLSLIASDRTFVENDLRVAQDLARWIAPALENAHVHASK